MSDYDSRRREDVPLGHPLGNPERTQHAGLDAHFPGRPADVPDAPLGTPRPTLPSRVQGTALGEAGDLRSQMLLILAQSADDAEDIYRELINAADTLAWLSERLFGVIDSRSQALTQMVHRVGAGAPDGTPANASIKQIGVLAEATRELDMRMRSVRGQATECREDAKQTMAAIERWIGVL